MAKKPVTKSQIITNIAESADISKKKAKIALESLIEMAYKNVKSGFTLPGLGKIVIVNRKARWGRNPQTGEKIRIKAKKVVKFRVSKTCKDAVVGK